MWKSAFVQLQRTRQRERKGLARVSPGAQKHAALLVLWDPLASQAGGRDGGTLDSKKSQHPRIASTKTEDSYCKASPTQEAREAQIQFCRNHKIGLPRPESM